MAEEARKMNQSPNRAKRIAFVLSGCTDALLGGILLLIGFGFLPVDVTEYGFQNWHALLLGGILFVTGILFVAYNLSRWDE
jgi:ABC-type branched-subunit amino acid transport system permease subunit